MNAKTKKPRTEEIVRSALRRAAGPADPDVGRLVEALPEILAEARRRRSGRGPVDPLASILVSLARTAIPRLAAVAAMLVLAASFLGFRGAPGTGQGQAGLDEYILTGEVGEPVNDLLLEAIAGEGNDHG